MTGDHAPGDRGRDHELGGGEAARGQALGGHAELEDPACAAVLLRQREAREPGRAQVVPLGERRRVVVEAPVGVPGPDRERDLGDLALLDGRLVGVGLAQ